MKTSKKVKLESLAIIKAINSFKEEYIGSDCVVSFGTSNSLKKEKGDKGYYDITYVIQNTEFAPEFLSKDEYANDVRIYFEEKLIKPIRFCDVSVSYSCNNKNGIIDTISMSIFLRF
jgi:hypothetical protein